MLSWPCILLFNSMSWLVASHALHVINEFRQPMLERMLIAIERPGSRLWKLFLIVPKMCKWDFFIVSTVVQEDLRDLGKCCCKLFWQHVLVDLPIRVFPPVGCSDKKKPGNAPGSVNRESAAFRNCPPQSCRSSTAPD